MEYSVAPEYIDDGAFHGWITDTKTVREETEITDRAEELNRKHYPLSNVGILNWNEFVTEMNHKGRTVQHTKDQDTMIERLVDMGYSEADEFFGVPAYEKDNTGAITDDQESTVTIGVDDGHLVVAEGIAHDTDNTREYVRQTLEAKHGGDNYKTQGALRNVFNQEVGPFFQPGLMEVRMDNVLADLDTEIGQVWPTRKNKIAYLTKSGDSGCADLYVDTHEPPQRSNGEPITDTEFVGSYDDKYFYGFPELRRLPEDNKC
jgi:hypothetical protein